MPPTTSRKFVYADDLAILSQAHKFTELNTNLNKDLEILEKYFKKWHLIPNPTKTVSSVFHLNNAKAGQALHLNFCQQGLKHDPTPCYLGVTLDRSLTFKPHTTKLKNKLKSRNNIISKLAGTTWGCGAEALMTSALALVYSTSEYCAPVWERSAHCEKIDVILNETMRTISGTIRSTPVPWLPVLCNIAPPGLRRRETTLKELEHASSNTQHPAHTKTEIKETHLGPESTTTTTTGHNK
jgi:hypothetical protein